MKVNLELDEEGVAKELIRALMKNRKIEKSIQKYVQDYLDKRGLMGYIKYVVGLEVGDIKREVGIMRKQVKSLMEK